MVSGWVTGTRPLLPDGALSSAQPVTNITITTAATATTKMMIRALCAGRRRSPTYLMLWVGCDETGNVSSASRLATVISAEMMDGYVVSARASVGAAKLR